MNKTIFHERLLIALKIKGMKQIELSNLTKINKAQISEYCSGKCRPKQDKLYSIAKVLQVNPGWLMGFDVDMDIKENAIKKQVIDKINEMGDEDLVKLNTIIDTIFIK